MDVFREMLVSAQSPDQEIRRGAEIAIHAFFNNHLASIPILLAFASDAKEDVHMRHLSILLLNQQIPKQWSHFGADIKRDITIFAFQWVSLFVSDAFAGSMSTFHRSATVLLAKVYDAGTFAEAEHIATALATELQSEQLPTLLFSLRCLYEIAREVQYDKHVDLLRICFPRVQALVISADSSNAMHNRILLYCVKFMYTSVRKFGDARIAVFDEHLAAIVAEYIPLWSTTAFAWVARHTQDMDAIVTSLPVIIHCLKSLTIAVDAFYENFGLDLGAVNDMSWTLLRNIRGAYGTRDHNSCEYSSDGDREDVEILVVHVFELLCASLSASGGVNAASLESEQASINSLVSLLSDYMPLNADQVEMWLTDGNEFISLEYDESLDSNLRHTGREVVNEICSSSRGVAYLSLVTMVQQSFEQFQGDTLPAEERQKQLLHLEGILWMLGSMRKKYVGAMKTCARSGEAISGKLSRSASILSSVPPASLATLIGSALSLIAEMPPDTYVHILHSRVLWLCGEYMDIFETDQSMTQLAIHCVTSMSPSVPQTLRFHSCRTLGIVLLKKKCNPALFADESHLLAALTSCSQLVVLADETTAHFPVETALSLLGDNTNISTEIVGITVALSLNTWFRFTSDPLVLDAARKLLVKTLRNAPNHATLALHSLYIPHLQKVFASADARIPSCFVDTMVRFLPILVKHAHDSYDLGGSSTLRLEVLQLLVGILNSAVYASSSCECMQAINCVLSSGTQEGLGLKFQPECLRDFANAIAQIVSNVFTGLIEEERGVVAESADTIRFNGCTGPAVGLFCHLLTKAQSVLPKENFISLVKQANICLQIHKSEYVRSTIGMGFSHLFARNPSAIASLLMQCQTEDGIILGNRVVVEASTGVPVLDVWYSLHNERLSCYNGTVSTLGLLELISILGAESGTEHLACTFLELLLFHLPRVLKALLPGNAAYDEDEDEDDFDDDDSYSNSDQDFVGDAGSEDWEDDDGEDESHKDAQVDTESPFAPAEMYLSDMINIHSSSGVSISDHLMYSPAMRSDPIILAATDATQRLEYSKIAGVVQDRVILFLQSQSQNGSFPKWMERLPHEAMRLVTALVNS